MYIWQEHYPEGVPFDIKTDDNDNIIDEIRNTIEKHPNRIAFTNMGKSITFSDVDRLSDHFATYLQNHAGLKQGSHVAVQMPNILQYPIVLFAILKAGMIAVNTNPLYTPRELKHQFKDSKAEALIVLENFAHAVEQIIEDTEIKTVVITRLGDMLGTIKGAIVNTVVKRIKKMIPQHNLNGISFKKAIKKGKKNVFKPVKLNAESIAFLQYTGGTTGVSKGAILSHGNIVANARQTRLWIANYLDLTKQNTVITPLPIYHIFSLTVNCLILFKLGCENVLITNPRDMKGFIRELSKHKFSLITGVNTLFNALLTQEKFRKLNFAELKVCCAGGMAVQDYVAIEWEKVTGVPLIEGYGLTETSPAIAFNPLNGKHRIGTIGFPMPSTVVEIRDENHKKMPVNEVGEICCYGPQVMKGYWNNQIETKKVLRDGWLYTGDMAKMHPDGYIEIVDRKKDMINVSGFNVFPFEIENVVMELEHVLEVAAIAVDDDKTTETVKLFIVSKTSELTEKMVMEHCKKNLTNYKRPKYIEFRESLPKTPIGKILKKDLRAKQKDNG